MRILLIATNRHNRWMSRDEVRPLPIGLAYVAAYIDPERHPLRVLDLMFANDYLAETEAVVREFQPQLIGISIRNLDNGSYVNPQSALPITREVIERIRSCSDATIACGGPAFSTLPQDCFNYLEPDVGLAGDAADAFAQLADLLEEDRPHHDLPGIVYRQEGEIRTAPHRASSGLDRPPRLGDLDLERYRQAGFGVGVITKLGWYSSTVASPASDDQWRIIRPVEEVVDEVQRLQREYSLEEFFFIDQAFNQPIQYAKDLCHSLLDAGTNIWWNTNLRPEDCDEELVSLMVESGCQMVLIGGASIPTLIAREDDASDSLRLSTDLASLQHLCDLCQSQNLTYSITQGFGEPGETQSSIRTKLAFLSAAAGPGRAANVTLRIGNRLLPGSELTRQATQEGIISGDSDLLMPVYYVTPAVRTDLLGTLEAAVQDHPTWNIM